jgi:glycosyltransferase involved in cell wall biosynthesis
VDNKFRRLKVLHMVGADNGVAPNALLLPLLTRGARQRIENQVVHFAQGDTQFGVVRQSGIPVHEVPLSLKRFSMFAPSELRDLISKIKPDVIHAWGATAHLAATFAAPSDKNAVPQVWSVARTTPLAPDAGWLDKQIFGLAKPARAKRIVFSSAVAAAQYRRAGWPEATATVIAAGIDADRYKPDPAARERVRKQLELPNDAVVIGMHAPYSPEFDHATLLKAVGELIRTNQHLYCVLAGRAMQKGNAVLMAAVGGGTLGTRTRLIGEWSDVSALFNACDVVCSSATTDSARLALAMAMSCGVPCVGTGVGAQGEVLGNFGIAVEPGSPSALVRGLGRALELPFERRAFVIHEARKHIWLNYNIARSIEKLHELYIELAPEVLGAAGKATNPAASLPPELAVFVPPKPPVVEAPPPETKAESKTEAKSEINAETKHDLKPVVVENAQEDGPKQNELFAIEPSDSPSPAEKPEPAAKADAGWSLDAALSTTMQSAFKPEKAPEPVADSMEWSESESELISSMMVAVDPSEVKPIVVERPKPKPIAAPVADSEQAEAKARAKRLMDARRAELQATTATAHAKPAAPAVPAPTKIAKG